VHFENTDMDMEIFMEDGFDNFIFAGFHIDSAEDPVFGLVFYAEPGFVFVPFDDKIMPLDPNNIPALDAHTIGSIGNDINPTDIQPSGKLDDAIDQFLLVIHAYQLISAGTGRQG